MSYMYWGYMVWRNLHGRLIFKQSIVQEIYNKNKGNQFFFKEKKTKKIDIKGPHLMENLHPEADGECHFCTSLSHQRMQHKNVGLWCWWIFVPCSVTHPKDTEPTLYGWEFKAEKNWVCKLHILRIHGVKKPLWKIDIQTKYWTKNKK